MTTTLAQLSFTAAEARLPAAHRTTIRQIVRGLYDLQKQRIASGNRVMAAYKVYLGQAPSLPEEATMEPKEREVLEIIRTVAKRPTDVIASMLLRATNPEEVTLSLTPSGTDEDDDTEVDEDTGDPETKDTKAVKLFLEMLARQYLVTRKADTPLSRSKFKPLPLMPTWTHYMLAAQYGDFLAMERSHVARLEDVLMGTAIGQWLLTIPGMGPMIAGVIISEIDIHEARYVSSIWKYAGLDVGPDGRGRGKHKEHLAMTNFITKGMIGLATEKLPRLVESGKIRDPAALVVIADFIKAVVVRPRVEIAVGCLNKLKAMDSVNQFITEADGALEEKLSLGYSPFLKTKLVGVMAGNWCKARKKVLDSEGKPIPNPEKPKKFLMTPLSPYHGIYADYKHRIKNDPARQDPKEYRPARFEAMARRYMTKAFLADLYIAWKTLEGLEVQRPYAEVKLGMTHRGAPMAGIWAPPVVTADPA